MQTSLSFELEFMKSFDYLQMYPNATLPAHACFAADVMASKGEPTEATTYLPLCINYEGHFTIGYMGEDTVCKTLSDAKFCYMRYVMNLMPSYLWDIKTKEDIKAAFQFLIVDTGLLGGFHPDTPFADYVTQGDIEGQSFITFGEEQAAYYQTILDRAWKVAEKLGIEDPYQIACDVYIKSRVNWKDGGINLYPFANGLETWDATEIHPVAIVSLDGSMEDCEQVDNDEEAHFWSVYIHLTEQGGLLCIADCETRALAEQVMHLMEQSISFFDDKDENYSALDKQKILAFDEIQDILNRTRTITKVLDKADTTDLALHGTPKEII